MQQIALIMYSVARGSMLLSFNSQFSPVQVIIKGVNNEQRFKKVFFKNHGNGINCNYCWLSIIK